MDSNGPFRAEAAEEAWCRVAGRQFAFQEATSADLEGNRDASERVPLATLKPDPQLLELFRSRKPVVYLDAIASLATREAAKEHGLSSIVKAELAALFKSAKDNGQAVVLQLGSDSPHTLAEKVYLRSPLAEYGLKCGYIRWRESEDAPWAREKPYNDRCCLCLQMQ